MMFFSLCKNSLSEQSTLLIQDSCALSGLDRLATNESMWQRYSYAFIDEHEDQHTSSCFFAVHLLQHLAVDVRLLRWCDYPRFTILANLGRQFL